MTEEEILAGSASDAAKVIARLPDPDALKLVVQFIRVRGFPLEDFLRMVKSTKGLALSYAEEARAEIAKKPRIDVNEARTSESHIALHQVSQNRYTTLTLVSSLNKIFGWITVVLGGVFFLIGLSLALNGTLPLFLLFTCGIAILFIGLSSVAFGELIGVFIDIEANIAAAA